MILNDVGFVKLSESYEMLGKYTRPVRPMTRKLVGRDREMRVIEAAFCRPELCNVCMIGEPGSGKTACVQGLAARDKKRIYLEVDLSAMIANVNDKDEMADTLKRLFGEVEAARERDGHEIVLFMDEFHQVVQLSSVAVEALKPLLADSGTRGVRVIAATTQREFREYIAPNQPLVERLERVDLREPDEETCVSILRGMAERYGVKSSVTSDGLYDMIYQLTNRYVPANAQPRKSILVLDAMVGWHRSEGRPLDLKLLADVIYDIEGINVSFKVDAATIRKRLDEHVIAQQYATRVIEQRLQLCVAGLNDTSKPMASFLFSGSTGTGKTAMCKQLAAILFNDSRRLIRLDMTEFANMDSLDRFRSTLTNMVWSNPYSIVLLDEIEKACEGVTRLLLQVLDDGRLTDDHGRVVTFANTYIVMTTNAGSEIYKTIARYESSDTGSGEFVSRYEALIRRSLVETSGADKFPPELLGRIDAIVPFQPLSDNTMRRIVEMKLTKIRQRVVERHGVDVKFTRDVVEYLVLDRMTTDSDAGGARGIMSKLDSEVTCAIARYLNENAGAKKLRVHVVGEMANKDKHRLVSSAHIAVDETDK